MTQLFIDLYKKYLFQKNCVMIYSTLQTWISYHRSKEAHFCFQDSPFSLLVFISLPRQSPSHTNHVASSLRLESHSLWAVYESQVVFPGHFVNLDSCTFTLQSNWIVLLDNIATDTLQSTDIIWQDADWHQSWC